MLANDFVGRSHTVGPEFARGCHKVEAEGLGGLCLLHGRSGSGTDDLLLYSLRVLMELLSLSVGLESVFWLADKEGRPH